MPPSDLRSQSTSVSFGLGLGLISFFACLTCGGGATTPVVPPQTSADQHRQEARRESEAADNLQRKAAPPGGAPSPFRDPITGHDSDAPPDLAATEPNDRALREAETHRMHAQQHLEAARALEDFEQAECKDVPRAERAACPLLGPVVDLQNIKGGVRARFTEGSRVDALVARMRCHFAYAQAHGFDIKVSCPLYMRGIVIQGGPLPLTVDITSSDPVVAKEIGHRAREEAVFVGGGNQAKAPGP